jgi:hypothetical protein
VSEGPAIGDVVMFFKEPEGIKHNALVAQLIEGGNICLVHVGKTYEGAWMPQVELDVPPDKPDETGRYYVWPY